MWKTLPVFTAYIAWTILTDAANYFISHRFQGIFQSVYLFEIVPDAILQFAVLIDLAWAVLRPSRSILPRGTIYLIIGLVLVVGLIVWPFAGMAVPPNLSPHGQLYVHFQETIAVLRVIVFLLLAGFSQVLSIGWKDRELQVATGLGFFAIISLIVAVLHSHQEAGTMLYHRLDNAIVASYVGALTYWVISLATKEQERKEFSPQMQELLLLMSGGARANRK